MGEIPDDIIATATRVLRDLARARNADDEASMVEAAILAERERCGWRPIETAPKTGAYMWLGNHANLRIGFWSKSDGHHDGYWIDLATSENPGAWVTGLHFVPTHWMPVPKPPVSVPSQIVPVKHGHAKTDFAAQSGDKSAAPTPKPLPVREERS